MATPDWIAATEYIVGADHPELPDSKNRAAQTIQAMLETEHDANGRHLAQDYVLVGEVLTYAGNGTEPRTVSLSNTTLTPKLCIIWKNAAQTPLERLDSLPSGEGFARVITTIASDVLSFDVGEFTIGTNGNNSNNNGVTFYYFVLGIDNNDTYTGTPAAGSDPTWITSSTDNLMIGDDTAAVSADNIGNNVESEIWTEFIEEHTVAGVHNPSPYANSHKVEIGTFAGTNADGRNISLTNSIDIKYLVIISDDIGDTARSRNETMAGDNTKLEAIAAFAANHIQSIGTGTFQVGSACNVTNEDYYWIAIGE